MELTINNYLAEVKPDQSLNMVMTSPYPLMATGLNGGNFIFHFDLPATPGLKQALKYAHRPGSHPSIVEVPYKLNIGGLHYSGIARVEEAGPFYYEVLCPIENGDFNFQAKKVMLTDLYLGEDVEIEQTEVVISESTLKIQHLNEVSSQPFEYLVDFSFDDITLNSGELTEDGKKFVSSQSQSLNFYFEIESYILEGLGEIWIYRNNEKINFFQLNRNGHLSISVNLDLETSDEISWKIFLVAELDPRFNVDYLLDAVIESGALLHVRQASYLQAPLAVQEGAEKRYPDINYAVFPIENPQIFAKWPTDLYEIDNLSVKELYEKYFKVVNYWYSDTFPSMLYKEREDGTPVEAANMICVFPYIAYLVKQIGHYFKFRIVNNIFEDELKYAVLVNHFIENRFINRKAKLFSEKSGFNLKDHVPNITVHEFLNELSRLFGFGYEVDNQLRTIEFNFVQDIIEDKTLYDISHLVVHAPHVELNKKMPGYRLKIEMPDEDEFFKTVKSFEGLNYIGEFSTLGSLPASADIGDYCWLKFSNQYYIWSYDTDLYVFGWNPYGPHFISEIKSGKNHMELSSKLCPLINVIKLDPILDPGNGRVWNIPASHQAGKFEGAPENFQTEWQPTIVWYHGLKNDSNGNAYPYASASNLDPDGNAISGMDLALTLDGESGLYEKKWKDYLTWRLSAKPIKVFIRPDHEFLRTFKFKRKLKINGVTYLAAQVRGTYKNKIAGIWELSLLVF